MKTESIATMKRMEFRAAQIRRSAKQVIKSAGLNVPAKLFTPHPREIPTGTEAEYVERITATTADREKQVSLLQAQIDELIEEGSTREAQAAAYHMVLHMLRLAEDYDSVAAMAKKIRQQ